MTTKRLRNNMFKEIEGIMKKNKSDVKLNNKVIIDLTNKLEEEQKKEIQDVLKVNYYKKEINALNNCIELLNTYTNQLQDTKEEIKREEKTLFVLTK